MISKSEYIRKTHFDACQRHLLCRFIGLKQETREPDSRSGRHGDTSHRSIKGQVGAERLIVVTLATVSMLTLNMIGYDELYTCCMLAC